MKVVHARVDFVKRPAYPQNKVLRPHRKDDLHGAPDIVSGRWLVKALLVTLIAAGAALYFTVCLLFYQGQWQFVFLPPKINAPVDMSQLAVSSGLPITEVKFDYTEQGVAHLDGWWVPATSDRIAGKDASRDESPLASQMTSRDVVLYCPNGRTTLRENVPALQAFHALGLAVFAFDYRGFGQSQSGHPSQQKAYADGAAALRYLTDTKHIEPKHIVVYGAGVGAAVAVHVALQSPEIAALVLVDPQPSFAKQVKREQHIHVLPLWLIFPDRFDIAPIVPLLKMPKLFIFTMTDADSQNLYRQASAPKQIVNVPDNNATPLHSQPAWQQAVREFLR